MGEFQVPITPEDLLEGEDVDFQTVKEDWNEYKLNDGTTLKVKLVLVGVKRLKKYQPDGKPIYVVNTTNVVRIVDVPEKLRMKPTSKQPSGTAYR